MGEQLLRELNGKLRNELLNSEIFCALREAQVLRCRGSRVLCPASNASAGWVTKRVTKPDRKDYLFRINRLQGAFESSPGHQINFT